MRQQIIDPSDLDTLIRILEGRGYEVIGPRIREAAIVYDVLHGSADLPRGWTDEQEAGHYRIRRRDDAAFFGYAVGPHSWKRFLFPPVERMWKAKRSDDGFQIEEEPPDERRRAFLGVRACELHAIAVQDRVFLGGEFTDNAYAKRRRNLFLVGVQCGTAGGTCFCRSMGTGPDIGEDCDLVLTEVLSPAHHFVARAGSEEGQAVLAAIPTRAASDEETKAADRVVENTANQMGRSLDTKGIKDLFYDNYEHPRWDDVAARCLACANCTMVCPTCFCTNVEDITDLTGDHAERWRQWDSCFTSDFSYISGGAIRPSTRSKYRQWITHKLATWIDQFGTSGCVGCGRCITWCPPGIDITEEARALREPAP